MLNCSLLVRYEWTPFTPSLISEQKAGIHMVDGQIEEVERGTEAIGRQVINYHLLRDLIVEVFYHHCHCVLPHVVDTMISPHGMVRALPKYLNQQKRVVLVF